MMDLALRLSQQEASVAASRRKREDDAVMKAVQESVSPDARLRNHGLMRMSRVESRCGFPLVDGRPDANESKSGRAARRSPAETRVLEWKDGVGQRAGRRDAR